MPDYLYQYGRGAVRNLATDRRLKRNRLVVPRAIPEPVHGAQGRVKNPDQDRRLKKNRALAPVAAVQPGEKKPK